MTMRTSIFHKCEDSRPKGAKVGTEYTCKCGRIYKCVRRWPWRKWEFKGKVTKKTVAEAPPAGFATGGIVNPVSGSEIPALVMAHHDVRPPRKVIPHRSGGSSHNFREPSYHMPNRDPNGDFLTSVIVAQVTDSALLGTLIGGSVAGGIVGDMLNDSDSTPDKSIGVGSDSYSDSGSSFNDSYSDSSSSSSSWD